MSKSTKALLLSALVFPGIGHFFLRKHFRGAVLSILSIVCLYILVSNALEIAQDISTKIETGVIPLDVGKVEDALVEEQGSKAGALNTATYLLEICWLVGVIDSFRIGRIQQKAEATQEKRKRRHGL